MKDFDKKIKELNHYLGKNEIDPGKALDIIKKTFEVNPNDFRVQWKMWRFTLYVWERLEEKKTRGKLGKKVDTIRRLVEKPKFERLWKTWAKLKGPMNKDQEIKKLNHLITDPRQLGYFKSMYLVYEGTQKNIPQDIIDEVR